MADLVSIMVWFCRTSSQTFISGYNFSIICRLRPYSFRAFFEAVQSVRLLCLPKTPNPNVVSPNGTEC
jgi:hypothetical protein